MMVSNFTLDDSRAFSFSLIFSLTLVLLLRIANGPLSDVVGPGQSADRRRRLAEAGVLSADRTGSPSHARLTLRACEFMIQKDSKNH